MAGACASPARGRGAEAREHLQPQPCRLAVGECRVVLEALRELGDGRAEAIGFGGAAQRDGRPAARAHRRDEQRGRRVGVEEAALHGKGEGAISQREHGRLGRVVARVEAGPEVPEALEAHVALLADTQAHLANLVRGLHKAGAAAYVRRPRHVRPRGRGAPERATLCLRHTYGVQEADMRILHAHTAVACRTRQHGAATLEAAAVSGESRWRLSLRLKLPLRS